MTKNKKRTIHEGRSILAIPFTSKIQRYFDFYIQKRLLFALVLMEVSLVVASVVYLYFRFHNIINESFYRIHQLPHSVQAIFLEETGKVILYLLAINLLALLIADRWWVRYIRSVLSSFGMLADKMADLDLRIDQELEAKHESLDMMLNWRKGERERAKNIRTFISQLESPELLTDETARQKMLLSLKGLRATLPPYSRRYIGRLDKSK
ncbi:MAG: hypothetical protein HQL69_01815 [Magnetococcales bacterium]|nr:hypothetical protein [Magnetococcales bacterium]